MIDGIFNSASSLGELRAIVPNEIGHISCGSRGFILKHYKGQQFALSYDKLYQWLYSQSKVKDIESTLNKSRIIE